MQAREIMSSPVRSIGLDTPVPDIAALMLETGFNSLPVTDENGHLRGIVAATDLMVRADMGTLLPREWWSRLNLNDAEALRAFIRTHGRLARHVMSPRVARVGPDASLTDVVAEMSARRIRAVVVLEGDQPVGVISRTDIVRALVGHTPPPPRERSDADIRADLMQLLEGEQWFHLEEDEIHVENGQVTFSGVVASREERLALLLAAQSIDGITAVNDETQLDLS